MYRLFCQSQPICHLSTDCVYVCHFITDSTLVSGSDYLVVSFLVHLLSGCPFGQESRESQDWSGFWMYFWKGQDLAWKLAKKVRIWLHFVSGQKKVRILIKTDLRPNKEYTIWVCPRWSFWHISRDQVSKFSSTMVNIYHFRSSQTVILEHFKRSNLKIFFNHGENILLWKLKIVIVEHFKWWIVANFLQPWWITFLKLPNSYWGSFKEFKFQNFVYPCWITILKAPNTNFRAI